MQIKNNYRYILTDIDGGLIAQPIGESDFTIEWNRDVDEGRREYKKEFGGSVIFTGEAYSALLALETSSTRCLLQNIIIQKKCGSTWIDWFTGSISMNDGEWDLDGCKVVLKFEEISQSQCYEDNKTTKVNLFSLIDTGSRVSVKMYPDGTSRETQECQTTANNKNEYFCMGGGIGDWISYFHAYAGHESGPWGKTTRWVRNRLTLPNSSSAPYGWNFLQDNGNGTSDYTSKAIVYDCYTDGEVFNDSDVSYLRTCEILEQDNITFRNGMPLRNILTALINNFCPGKTVRSDFFQINPIIETDINYVTGLKSKVRNIIVFQKSDVKLYNATGVASKAEWDLQSLLEHLKFMFNVDWRIEGNTFIIEHVSYYGRNNGLDLTLPKYARNVSGKRKYTYKNEDIPGQEVWRFKEASFEGDFMGLPVTYTNCVSNASKSETKNYEIEKVTTDVQFITENADQNNDVVSMDGFVFMATELIGSTYVIINEASILGGNTINNSLAISQLLRDYHRHDRPLKYGNMNGVNIEFISALPIKKGEKITIPLCCDDSFNPDDTILTPLGNGIVDKATFNFRKSTLELDLLYMVNTGTINKPIAHNIPVTRYTELPVFINIADFVDLSEGDVITYVIIVAEPTEGTAVVLPNKTIRYTASSSIPVDDLIMYKVINSLGYESNTATILLTHE